MLDGRIARLTGTESDFGAQLDSLADVISFGIAPAILAFSWGLAPLGRLGWAAGFLYVAAAAMRLARFNIQSTAGGDKRYFVGMPSPPAAGVTAATVFAYPAGFPSGTAPWVVLAMVLVPAFLMVSTIRFRSFKTIDLRIRRPYTILLLIAVGLVLITVEPRIMLAAMAYTYLVSAFVGMAITKFKHRGGAAPGSEAGGAGRSTDRDAAAR
jgi:CDP-diacylglycerol--serine O-phosphatidyltransferase